jgi:hypothetical protein
MTQQEAAMCNARLGEKDSDHDGLMEKDFEGIVTTVSHYSNRRLPEVL